MVTSQAIERTADLIKKSKYAIAVTGAGMSAESGIPTYRGKGGLWTSLAISWLMIGLLWRIPG